MLKKPSFSTILSLLNTANSENNEETRRKLCVLAREILTAYIAKAPTIADMKGICEKEGYIPAIKEWRSTSNLSLSDAKEQIDRAIKLYGWKDYRIGKSALIINSDSPHYGKTCEILHISQLETPCSVLICGDETPISVNKYDLRVLDY